MNDRIAGAMPRIAPVIALLCGLVFEARSVIGQTTRVVVRVDSVPVPPPDLPDTGRVPMVAMRGDTLVWIVPGARFAAWKPAGGTPADTLVLLFARDSVYRLEHGERTPVPPYMAQQFRQLRSLAETDRALRAAAGGPRRR